MKKINVSLFAVLVGLPITAQAADIAAATKVNIAANTNVATTSFVGGAHDALVDEINTNRNAINTLNGDANTTGSVANTVATAIAGKQDTIDATHKLNADLVDDSASNSKFVTAAEKSTWNAKQDQLTNGTANVSATVATTVRDDGVADNATLVTEKAVRDAVKSATYDDTNLSGRVTTLETTVGNSSAGLVKDVDALETTVGDSSSGLVKAVADNTTDINTLKTTVGDSTSGLVKAVADNTTDINALETTVGDSTSGLVKDVADLKAAADVDKGFNVYGSWATPNQSTGTVTVSNTQ